MAEPETPIDIEALYQQLEGIVGISAGNSRNTISNLLFRGRVVELLGLSQADPEKTSKPYLPEDPTEEQVALIDSLKALLSDEQSAKSRIMAILGIELPKRSIPIEAHT